MSSLCIFTTTFSSFSENSNSIGSLILVLCHKIFSLSKFVHRQFHVVGTTCTVPEINLTRMLTHIDTWESWDQVGWIIFEEKPQYHGSPECLLYTVKGRGSRGYYIQINKETCSKEAACWFQPLSPNIITQKLY